MTCQNCGTQLDPTLRFCTKCGTPTSASAYAPPTLNQVQPSWSPGPSPAQPKQKSYLGKILLILGIAVVLIVGGVVAMIYYGYKFAERTLKSSEPYVLAEQTLRESPQVRERMGEIKNMGFPIGAFQEQTDGTGHATFTIAVIGEKASGQYVVTLERSERVWRVERGFVKLTNDEIITVTDSTSTESDPDVDAEDPSAVENPEESPHPHPRTGSPTQGSKPAPKVVSGGVLNGKAISKPAPPYPEAARAARAQGVVTVAITVDEEGKVISAEATSGHPLLRPAAVSAARQARFSPTLLAGQPVKVTGTITYNFTLQ